jgi:hypothetical protein
VSDIEDAWDQLQTLFNEAAESLLDDPDEATPPEFEVPSQLDYVNLDSDQLLTDQEA